MIDVAIVGGGVSGLWILNRLRSLGYDAHLFERTALGSGQTIASQGIIHGGAKYVLNGIVPPLANSLRAMPERWTKCLEGRGEIDLRGVQVLAKKHELRLQNRLFEIPLWTFPEPVLDVKILIRALAKPYQDFIYLGVPVPARATIYCCGRGNEAYDSNTQRRPLRMFMVKPSPLGAPVYLHWVGRNKKPLMTVTTHFLNGEQVLYLGGNVAEKAVGMPDDQALLWAYSELQYRFPGYNWKACQWAIHDVDRAEPKGEPEGPIFRPQGTKAVVWPTKLALAPVLGDMAAGWLRNGPIQPNSGDSLGLPPPPIAPYPWEVAQWQQV